MSPPLPIAPDPAALEAIRVEQHVIEGFNEPHTPAEFNKAIYLRFFSGEIIKPRDIVVLMPGIFGGATKVDRMARTIISQDKTLEVWAIDRRSNLLEDHHKLLESWQTNDPMIAWRSMVRDAGKQNGFSARAPKDVAFMGYWGLETHLGDLRAVIIEAQAHAPKIVLGGHSLGSVLVTIYAGWDFSGQSGASSIDGLILLDGAAGNTLAVDISRTDYESCFDSGFAKTAGSKAFESGQALPYLEI
jgi:pimeloyl-ACP methyl ester carboxylesterase